MTGSNAPDPKEPQSLDGERPTPEAPAVVNLPAVLSDEFGTPRSEARMDIATGRVEIDGEEYAGPDKFDIPTSALKGKRIKVISDRRTYTFDYSA